MVHLRLPTHHSPGTTNTMILLVCSIGLELICFKAWSLYNSYGITNGTCMSPLLNDGDIIQVDRLMCHLNRSIIGRGDIITFYPPPAFYNPPKKNTGHSAYLESVDEAVKRIIAIEVSVNE